MLNDLSFFLTHTQAVALKGGNVSFELVLAEERWLTLMQNRRGGRKEKRKRLQRKAERERCAVKTEKKGVKQRGRDGEEPRREEERQAADI